MLHGWNMDWGMEKAEKRQEGDDCDGGSGICKAIWISAHRIQGPASGPHFNGGASPWRPSRVPALRRTLTSLSPARSAFDPAAGQAGKQTTSQCSLGSRAAAQNSGSAGQGLHKRLNSCTGQEK